MNAPGRTLSPALMLALVLAAGPALAQTLTGRVVAVPDGDTISVVTAAGRRVTVRLHGADAPERGQDFGAEARQFTSALALGRTVRVVLRGRDDFGRTVGKVYLPPQSETVDLPPASRPAPLPNRPIDPTGAQPDLPRGIPGEREAIPPPSATRPGAPSPAAVTVTRDLERELVRAGLAWWLRPSAPGDRTLSTLERQARAARRGLWAQRNPVAPWRWRNGKPAPTSVPIPPSRRP